MEEPASMMWNTKYGMFARAGLPAGALRGMGMMMGGAADESAACWGGTAPAPER